MSDWVRMDVSWLGRARKAVRPGYWVTIIAVAAGLQPFAAPAQGSCCSLIESGSVSVQAVAGSIRQEMLSAYKRLTADYGERVFISRVGEVQTPNGQKTIGEVWGEYLDAAGYPNSMTRDACVGFLVQAGLSDTAAAGFVLSPADYDSFEDVVASLNKVARARSRLIESRGFLWEGESDSRGGLGGGWHE